MSGAICPCGSGRLLEACCGQFHSGERAPDAEILMRSRYSAYVLGLEDYLQATWHPDNRPATLELDATPRPRWLGLAIKAHTPLDEHHATVEFIARYKLNGRAFKLHEVAGSKKSMGTGCMPMVKFANETALATFSTFCAPFNSRAGPRALLSGRRAHRTCGFPSIRTDTGLAWVRNLRALSARRSQSRT